MVAARRPSGKRGCRTPAAAAPASYCRGHRGLRRENDSDYHQPAAATEGRGTGPPRPTGGNLETWQSRRRGLTRNAAAMSWPLRLSLARDLPLAAPVSGRTPSQAPSHWLAARPGPLPVTQALRLGSGLGQCDSAVVIVSLAWPVVSDSEPRRAGPGRDPSPSPRTPTADSVPVSRDHWHASDSARRTRVPAWHCQRAPAYRTRSTRAGPGLPPSLRLG